MLMDHASVAARITAWPRITTPPILPLWIKQINRGVFLAKVRAEFARTMVRPRRDRKLLVRPWFARCELFTFFRTLSRNGRTDPPIAPTVSNICQNSVEHWRWACATQRRPHHCSVKVKGAPARPQYPLRGSDGRGFLVSVQQIMQPAPLASKEMPPHLVCRRGKNIRYSILLKRPLGPGLERLKANALCSQRSLIMGHHFFITSVLLRSRALEISPFA